MENQQPIKGEFMGECNRTACNNKESQFFNHSTHKYYCTPCARIINDVNKTDSQRLFGHQLCTLGEHKLELITTS